MRFRHLVLAAPILLTAFPTYGEPVEYLISFSQVTVRGFTGIYDTPEMAHLRASLETEAQPPTTEKEERLGDPVPVLPGAPPVTVKSPPTDRGRPANPMAFAPGEGTANPSFTEHGFLVEAFWAAKTGTPEAYFRRGHFHPANLNSGFEAQHLGGPHELHGIYIRSLDGKPFGVKSLRYRVTRNRELPRKPTSIDGFSNYDVNVLLTRMYNPRGSTRAQFMGFPVGLPVGNDLTLPWWTLPVTGFELVEQIYIASSASVDFDDIVLVRFGGAPSAQP